MVAHVTRDSDTTFKVKRSKVKFTMPLYSPPVNTSGSCSGERGNVLSVRTYCYVAVCRCGGRLGGARRFGAHRGRRGAGHIVTACWYAWPLYLELPCTKQKCSGGPNGRWTKLIHSPPYFPPFPRCYHLFTIENRSRASLRVWHADTSCRRHVEGDALEH